MVETTGNSMISWFFKVNNACYNEIDGACSTYGGEEMQTGFGGERDHLENLDVNGG
jgi:hypothetical protein